MPVADQVRDIVPLWLAVARAQYAEWLGGEQAAVANGNANLAQAEVKRQDAAGRAQGNAGQACPARALIRFMSIPSAAAAACSRCSGGVWKIMP